MVLGMSLEHFTLLHVLICIAGITSGFVVAYGLRKREKIGSLDCIFPRDYNPD